MKIIHLVKQSYHQTSHATIYPTVANISSINLSGIFVDIASIEFSLAFPHVINLMQYAFIIIISTSKSNTFNFLELKLINLHFLPPLLLRLVSLSLLHLLILLKLLPFLALTHGLALHRPVFEIGLEHGPVPNNLDEFVLLDGDVTFEMLSEVFALCPFDGHRFQLLLLLGLLSFLTVDEDRLFFRSGIGCLFFICLVGYLLPCGVGFIGGNHIIVTLRGIVIEVRKATWLAR